MKLSETIDTDPMRGLLYAASGLGKTTLLGLMAAQESLRPIYYFDWDLRIMSLRARVPKELWEFIDSDPYRDKSLGGEAFVLMQAKMEKLEALGFKTVVIDSFTFCMRGIMARILQLDGGKASTSTPQLQHYMQQMSLAEETISRACAKKFNFWITCHEDTSRDEMSGRLFKSVDLTGKMANRIPGYFNEMWHCEVRQQQAGQPPEYVVRTKSDAIYSARTSFRTLEAVESQATIWQKIMKERSST